MEELYKALDEVINSITESDEYKTCIELKDRMSKNINITDKITQNFFLFILTPNQYYSIRQSIQLFIIF